MAFLVSIFTTVINSTSLPACTLYKKRPQIFRDVQRGLTTQQITLMLLSCRQPIAIDY